MGENFESCHVPQQSRRNKLRVMVQTHQPQSFSPTFSLPESSCFASQLEYPSSFHSLQGSCSSNELRNWVPLGPFTGYASILKQSRFLKPAQQLLEDFCGSVLDPPMILVSLRENDNHEDPISATATSRDEIQFQYKWRDSRLTCMLEEVYNKYTLYYQQIQSVVASFQKVAGLGKATPYISFGIKTISKHFGCLKLAIYDQLQFTTSMSTPAANYNFSEKEILKHPTFEKGLGMPESVQNLNSVQPILRSQRGLPDHAVALLRRWLFKHFLHPYPTDSEKDTLAQQTGLSRCQVSNWFINARVRIWKPMVEEMHMLGDHQAQPVEVSHNVSRPAVGPFAASQQAHVKILPHPKKNKKKIISRDDKTQI